MKKIALFLMGLFILSGTVLMANGQGEKAATQKKNFTLKYAGVLPYDHPTSRAIEKWAVDLEKRTKGRIKIQLYHGGSMGKSTEVIQYLQQGTIAFSNISTAFFSSYNKKFDIFSLPYLFRDKKKMEKALNGDFGKMVKNLLLKDGIRGLAFLDSGSRSVYTKSKPIYSPKDMKGLKIRVMSKVAVATMNALDANGVPIPWGELYTSLQTGVVDAAENNPPSIIAGKHYEVCKYYSLTEHFRTPDFFVMSEKAYKELDPELQKAVIDSVNEELIPVQEKLFSEATQKSIDELKKLGMKINKIPDLTPFVKATASVRTKVAKSIGMLDWLEKIEKM